MACWIDDSGTADQLVVGVFEVVSLRSLLWM